MEQQRWEQVQAVLEEALAAPQGDRKAVLAARCGRDEELRQEVSSLIAASEAAGTFFEGLPERIVDAVDAETSAAWLTSGVALEGFRVIEKLDSGGMGDVYRATDERLQRDVALKVLSETSVNDPKLVARFNREARMLAALNHPSIAAIHGLEVVGGRTVLVLELVEGPTLAERLKTGQLSVDDALEVGKQIASALQAAHDAGIVHRDLKPANIKFTNAGQLKVLDFGISKALRPFASSDAVTGKNMDAITVADGGAQVLGTIPYMSPEQLEKGDVGISSDLWSLGVVLFESLSGQRPFQGDFPSSTIARILEREPDWGLLPSDVPQPLIELVRRCLQKDTSSRVQTASEAKALLEALDIGATTDSTSARTSGGPSQAGQGLTTFDSSEAGVLQQDIRFCTADDGVQVAYATVGKGMTVVKTANWLNHLEYDWDSPVWRHLFNALAADYRLIRYDERGNGLSDWDVEDISFPAFVRDLETVIETAAPDKFALLGISQGSAVSIAYSVAHPERVSRLILLGGYALGAAKRGSEEDAEAARALATIMHHGWGQDNPAFRQLFTSGMIPGATREQMDWFNDLQRMTASPETAYRLRQVFNEIDVTHLLAQVRVPTLVLHARGDALVPFEQGRMLARGIPGARFCPLESNNHLILEDEPAWPRFLEEVHRFLAEEG